MKKNLLKSVLLALMVLVGGNAWAAEPLTPSLEVTGYVKSHFIDFVNKDFDGTTLTSFDDLPGLGVTAQNTVGESYGSNNWYNWNGNLRLQSGGSRWIQFTLSIKADDYIIINGAAAAEAYEISMTDGTATTIANVSDYLCFKANQDMDALKLTVHRYNYLSQILVLTKDASAATAEYAINYVLDETVIKSVTGELAVGATVTTEASFFVDDVKYIRADGEAESFEIAANGNTFTVNVREAETFTYFLTTNLNTAIAATGIEGETVYAPYNRYMLVDGMLYEAPVSNKEYRKALTLTEDNMSVSVEYAEKQAAVFFVEGEAVEGMNVSTFGNIPVRASNAQAGISEEDVTITTLAPGKYIFHAGVFTSKTSEQAVYIGYGETQLAFSSSSNLNESASEEITLTAETAITYFGTTSSADAQLDYLWIEKTGDVEPEYYPFTGTAYVIDTESGLFMAAGHNWGTQGIVNELGLDLIFTANEQNKKVTIDTRVSQGGESHFLGGNLYMDSEAYEWGLVYQNFGFWIRNADGQYISLDYDNNLVLSDTPHEWIIVTAEGVMQTRLEEMAEATATNPVDATFLLQDPNFNRNDQRVAAWEISEDCTNHNFNGNSVNDCAESWHSTFTIKQTVSNVPAGVYELTAQGFYRQDGEAEAVPQFFANGVNADVPVIAGSENDMGAASESFTAGLYTIEPIRFTVGEDGMMYVGVYGTALNQWVIFDNFQLKYFGEEIVDAISSVNAKAENNAIYNLNGQKMIKAQKGLYIQNGKKFIVK
jgi:hypothetical protein